MQQIYSRTPMPKCDFNISAKQLYWNHTSEWECFTRTHLESCFCLCQGSVCIMQKSVLISNGNKSTASYMMKILNFIKKVLEVSKKDVTHWENPCLKSSTLSKYSLIGWKNYLHLRKVKGLKRHFQECNWLKKTILVVYSPTSGQCKYFILIIWFSEVFKVHKKEVLALYVLKVN